MWILCLNIFAVMIDISFLYQGNEHFGKISIINIITKLLMVASIFLFVKTSSDVWVYVLINTLCLVFPNAMLWLFLNGYITKVKLNSLSVFVHIKGVFVLFIPTVSLVLYAMIDKSLIGFITNSDVQNGFYEQAEKIFRFALTIITCMAVVMVARNAKYFAQNRVDDIKQNIYKSSHFVWVLSIPMCLGMVCVAPNFIPWFLGEDFIGSNSILQVLSTLFVLMGLSNVLGAQYMLPTMKDKKYTIVILCGATLNIMLNIPLIYLWGALGASIATVVSELIVCVVMFCLVRKELSLKEMFKTIWKPLLSGIMMFGVIFPLSMLLSPSILNTFIIVFVGIAVYALMILALKDDLVLSLIKQVFAKVFKRNRK